ncbi:hypothetical protein [Nonomuraea dietziae]
MCPIPASTDSRTVSRHRAASSYDTIVWTDLMISRGSRPIAAP